MSKEFEQTFLQRRYTNGQQGHLVTTENTRKYSFTPLGWLESEGQTAARGGAGVKNWWGCENQFGSSFTYLLRKLHIASAFHIVQAGVCLLGGSGSSIHYQFTSASGVLPICQEEKQARRTDPQGNAFSPTKHFLKQSTFLLFLLDFWKQQKLHMVKNTTTCYSSILQSHKDLFYLYLETDGEMIHF